MPKFLDFEQYVFYCDCGLELRTDKHRAAKCKCGREYMIEKLPQKFLYPEKKGNPDAIQNGSK